MFVLRLLIESLLLITMIWTPGVVVLRWAGFRGANAVDRWLSAAVVGLGYVAVAGMVLGLIGIYTRVTLGLVLLAPTAFLVYDLLRRPRGIAPGAWGGPSWWRGIRSLDGIAVGVASLSLAFWYMDCLTSPFRTWDSLVSFDKWATDWGQYWSMRGYLFGGYGQELPIISSVLYKLAGTARVILPPESFVNHALHPLIALILMLALYRLCRLLEAPAWFGIMSFFGCWGIQSMIPYGYSDLLLAASATAALALTLAFIKGEWHTDRHPAWILSSAFFVAAFVKVLSLFWIALTAILMAQWRARERKAVTLARPPHKGLGGRANEQRDSGRLSRPLWLIYVLALAPIVVFIGEQSWVNAYFDVHRIDPTAHMFTFQDSRYGIAVARQSMAANPWTVRFRTMTEWVVGPGPAPRTRQKVAAVALMILFLCALAERKRSWLVLFVLIYFVFYFETASYDLRNLIICLPLIAALAARGYTVLSQSVTAWLPLSMPFWAALSLAIFLLLGINLISAQNEHCSLVHGGLGMLPQRIAERVRNMSSPMPQRAVLLFPEYAPTLQFLRQTPAYRWAPHVIANSPMYRLFRDGLYSLREFAWEYIGPGDLFIAPSPFLPASAEKWILLRNSEYRVWIRQRDDSVVPLRALAFTGVHPPRLLSQSPTSSRVEFTGTMSILAFQIPTATIRGGDSYVWKARIATPGGNSRIRGFYLTSFGAKVNAGINPIATETQTEPLVLPGDNDHIYSGILTLQRELPPIAGPVDGVLVGLTCDEPGQLADVKEFRFSAYRAGMTN